MAKKKAILKMKMKVEQEGKVQILCEKALEDRIIFRRINN